MNITVNDKEVEFDGVTLSELLEQLEFGNEGYAVAVGSSIISKDKRKDHQLKDSDSVTVIVATHGG